MIYAHTLAGIVSDYPYHLRAIDGGDPARSAKRLYPDFPPLPATWDQCTPEQLAALNAVPVLPTERPALQPGESVSEATPAFSDGAWRQAWTVHPAPAPSVPDSVPAHHMRRALAAAGLLSTVQAYIDALPESDGMRIDWEYAPAIRRDAVGIEAARVALGLSEAQVDALFVAAGQVVT